MQAHVFQWFSQPVVRSYSRLEAMSESVSLLLSFRSRWIDYLRPRRFQYLLVIFLAYSLVNPLLGQSAPARGISTVVSSLAMVQTCLSVLPKKNALLVGSVLGILSLAYIGLVGAANHNLLIEPLFQSTARVIAILFYTMAGTLIFKDVFRPGEVNVNKLCGSICLYILIGVLWGQLYQLCDILDPGCFLIDEHRVIRPDALSFLERTNVFNYFSFVTLSTLGYGDISPVSNLTRTLAYSEAIVGQLYIAVLVSRLVGLHIAASTSATDPDD